LQLESKNQASKIARVMGFIYSDLVPRAGVEPAQLREFHVHSRTPEWSIIICFLRGRATHLMCIAINSIADACPQIVFRKFLTGCASYFIQDSSRDDVIAHCEEKLQ
jgi:hypothetical protein